MLRRVFKETKQRKSKEEGKFGNAGRRIDLKKLASERTSILTQSLRREIRKKWKCPRRRYHDYEEINIKLVKNERSIRLLTPQKQR